MKKLKIGVIGVGSMGSGHLQSIGNVENLELVAVCDIDREQADKLAAKHEVKAWYDGYELIKSGDVEAIIIATPHYDHTPLSVAGLEAGLHVLTEKPIAVHKADAQKMIDAHAAHPELKFAAMFQMRTQPLWKKVKSLIDSGELGEILRVNWIITNWFRSQAYYDSGGWRATWEGEGGGVLLNQCPHNIDLFQWYFGMPERVRANCAIAKYHNIEVEDDVTAFLEYPNGATGIFITSTGEAPGTNRLEITADRGRLVVENGKISFSRNTEAVREFCRTTETRFNTPENWDISIPVATDPGAHHQQVIANFADAILEGKELIAPAEEGIKSVELANSMLLSSISGKSVEIPMDAELYAGELRKLIDNSEFKKEVKEAAADDFANSFK